MALKRFEIIDKSVVGDHTGERGKDEIVFEGRSAHDIYAYFEDEFEQHHHPPNRCQDLVGQDHMTANERYPLHPRAPLRSYVLSTKEPSAAVSIQPVNVPTNGKIRVGS